MTGKHRRSQYRQAPRQRAEEAITASLVTDACIEWTGFVTNRGYGSAEINGKRVGAHRLVYETAFGPIPTDLLVCHTCDNRSCVNLSHLFLGTKLDNARDMVSKDRSCRGERQGQAVLTEKDVIEIRYLSGVGVAQRGIARQFGVSQGTITDAVRRVTWRHVA